MKICRPVSQRQRGFALLLVLILVGISLIIVASALNRSQSVAIVNQRNNEYTVCCNAAEAAVEKSYAQMVFWFQSYNVSGVTSHMTDYQTNIPNATDSSYWSNFIFTDPSTGTSGRTFVSLVGTYGGALPSAYTGLYCTTNSPIYRIVSNVQMTNSTTGVIGSAQEDVLLALVPLNTWAIFYNGLLEFTQCATMVVNGRVQANGNIYVGTSASLTFASGVSTTGTVTAPADDGLSAFASGSWNTTFNATPQYSTNVASVTVSLNMTNSHFIIDVPAAGEDPASSTGSQRLYNQAQMILIVTNDINGAANPMVLLTLQNAANGNVPGTDSAKAVYTYTNQSPSALNTNLPFLSLTNITFDQREQDTNLFTQINVSNLSTWITATNSPVQAKMSTASGQYPTILYVADRRNHSATQLPSVRLMNGAQLPANNGMGFSVATPNPLYVQGNYNITTSAGSAPGTNTYEVPAALFSDALTVLSPSWLDSDGFTTYNNSSSTFNASDMTINAAIVTGTMPSTGTSDTTFSGGVHNLPRLLENWSKTGANGTGNTLSLNTSILRLYNSQMATNQFRNPQGFSPTPINPYYNPPTRHYTFDQNYLDPTKVPPGIPLALVPIRFAWCVPPPGTTNYVWSHN